MSQFFESEVVRNEMEEITRLQEEVYDSVWKFPTMTKEEKVEHVDVMGQLLEKQKILYTRMSLSDDPEAKNMKNKILESARSLGFPEDVDLNYIFSNMTKLLESMKKNLHDS
jgi:hypothetical protein